jgi:hypothetical protein
MAGKGVDGWHGTERASIVDPPVEVGSRHGSDSAKLR